VLFFRQRWTPSSPLLPESWIHPPQHRVASYLPALHAFAEAAAAAADKPIGVVRQLTTALLSSVHLSCSTKSIPCSRSRTVGVNNLFASVLPCCTVILSVYVRWMASAAPHFPAPCRLWRKQEICHYGCPQMRLRRFGGVGEGFSIIEN
jgi:hypothetical protein